MKRVSREPRLNREEPRTMTRPAPARAHAVAASIAAMIERRSDESLSLKQLAGAAGVSVYSACRAFRRVHGTTIHRHHVEIRLGRALALVRDTQLPLAT